jgi:hypothetical protein
VVIFVRSGTELIVIARSLLGDQIAHGYQLGTVGLKDRPTVVTGYPSAANDGDLQDVVRHFSLSPI